MEQEFEGEEEMDAELPELPEEEEEEFVSVPAATKKARGEFVEESMAEEGTAMEEPEPVDGFALVRRAENLPGVRTTKDPETGELRTYAVAGTGAYEDIISRFDKARGRPKEGSEAEARERQKMVASLMEQYHIRVPATPADMENPHVEVEEHEIEPGGPKMPTTLVVPNPQDPLHVELLWKQKGQRIYDQTVDSTTGRPGVVSIREAMTNRDRIPYRLSREELVRTYNIKSPKTLAVSEQALNQATEFYAANLQEQLRESSLLPTPVPTPWLLFVYDSSPKGMALNSYTLISKYMMIYHALEAKIKNVSQASRDTKALCNLAAYGKLETFEGEPPAYAMWEKHAVLTYIREWQEARAAGKKAKHRVNLKHKMTPKRVFCWAFFSRTLQSNILTQAYYSSVVQLVRMHASEMDLEGLITITSHEGSAEGEEMSTRLDKYETVMERVSTNPKFLRNLYKLHCEYMFAYIRNLEDFLLFLSFQHIPITSWDHMIMPPLVDPTYPPGTYNDEAHIAVAAAVSALEQKTLMGTIREIREITAQVQIQHLIRMGQATLEKPPDIVDDSDRIYAEKALSVPTFFQMKLYCQWLRFVTEEVDHKSERTERDRLLGQNIRDRIEQARSVGRNVILHTREGETVEAFPKASGKRREGE
jgi:hypothetical protein